VGKPTGFLEIPRETPTRRPVAQRISDYLEVYDPFPEEKMRAQGARCMDCGIPFCHQGCPLGNLIPDWNDLVYRNQWRAAIDRLPEQVPDRVDMALRKALQKYQAAVAQPSVPPPPDVDLLTDIVTAHLGADAAAECEDMIRQFAAEATSTRMRATDQLMNAIYLVTQALAPEGADRTRVIELVLKQLTSDSA